MVLLSRSIPSLARSHSPTRDWHHHHRPGPAPDFFLADQPPVTVAPAAEALLNWGIFPQLVQNLLHPSPPIPNAGGGNPPCCTWVVRRVALLPTPWQRGSGAVGAGHGFQSPAAFLLCPDH
jgi:hypothetical protein